MIDIDFLEQTVQDNRFADAGVCFREHMQALTAQGHLPLSQIVVSSQDSHASDEALAKRLASIFHAVFVAHEIDTSVPDYDALMSWQIVLSQIFYLAGQSSADTTIEALLAQSNGHVSGALTMKLFLLFGTESAMTAQLYPLFIQNSELLLNTCMAQVWGCSGTEQSCNNREWAYDQIPKLFDILPAPSFPLTKIHGFFMHCSYGFANNKHALKQSLNRIIQQKIKGLNLVASLPSANPYLPKAQALTQQMGKKVLLVVLEMFNEVHSVYRALGKSLRALKQNYTLVAVAWPGYVTIDAGFFDELILLSAGADSFCAQEMLDIAAAYKPVAVYYPALGMTPWAIYHSNMRLAPVQFAAIGHGASSFATEIDYFLIESDIAGDASTYSEQVVALKPGAMPFYPPGKINFPKRARPAQAPEVLNIVCSTSSMKLNFKLLQICKNVAEKYKDATQQVAFHFFVMAHGQGLTAQSYQKLILSYLPEATIHVAMDFQSYANALTHMHISISTFPFAGMNTIIDFARSGIPGVRMDGPEVHEAFDPGMWRRMGMPQWAIVDNEAAYEAALCRMIDSPELRQTMSEQLQLEERWKVFFNGDAMKFVMAVDQMIAQHQPRAA